MVHAFDRMWGEAVARRELDQTMLGTLNELKEFVERLPGRANKILDRVANNLQEYAETNRRLDAGEPFEIEQSGEYAAVIVHALLTGQPARIVAPHGAERATIDLSRPTRRRAA